MFVIHLDEKLDYMIPDSDPAREAIPMWWDGNTIRFDAIPAHLFAKPVLNKSYENVRYKISSSSNSY